MTVLGAVMAGGRNTRYGGLKALAEVGGVRIIDRVIGSLRAVTDDIVVIANDPVAYESVGLPVRRDDDGSAGAPIAGLLTALRWAQEKQHAGIVAIACDMPFTVPALVQEMIRIAQTQNPDVVAPESGGRRGVEPLCAYYGTACVSAIEDAIARRDLRTIAFYDAVRVVPVPINVVRSFGDPAVLFMNVNRQEELAVAQTIAAEKGL